MFKGGAPAAGLIRIVIFSGGVMWEKACGVVDSDMISDRKSS